MTIPAHQLHLFTVFVTFTGAQSGALAIYWFLVYRRHGVRWARSRSREELSLIAGRAGFFRILISLVIGQLLGTALSYQPSMSGYFGSRLGYVAVQVPVVLGVWALIAGGISTSATSRLSEEDPERSSN